MDCFFLVLFIINLCWVNNVYILIMMVSFINSILVITKKLCVAGSRDHILGDEAVKERELFISDATDVYPAVALK